MHPRHFALLASLALTACGDESAVETKVAFDSDFASFQQWTRFELGDAPLVGHPPGSRFAFVNHPRPAGATEWPVGTIIVKTIEPPDVENIPANWEVFAMVKRGGTYNPEGAVGWEFFRLQINTRGIPIIRARGYNPTDGHGYMDALGNEVGCNSCHGGEGSAAHDHVLSPMLQ